MTMRRAYGLADVPDDPRNDRYLTRDVIAAQRPRRQMWATGPILNQGQRPACVGFAFAAEALAAPCPDWDVDRGTATSYGLSHWQRAQWLWAGYLDANQGTSMLSGAKVAVERGIATEYRWARTAAEVRDAVIAEGPVVIGVNWRDSMDSVRRDGSIRVDRRRASHFAHAVVIVGYDPERGFAIRNSWGDSWGERERRRVRVRRSRWTRRQRRRPARWRRRHKHLRRSGWRRVWRTGPSTGLGWLAYDDLAWLMADRPYDCAVILMGRQPVDLAATLAEHPDPTRP